MPLKFSALVAAGIVSAQTDHDKEQGPEPDAQVRDVRLTPESQQRQFHPMPTVGSSAADAGKSYADGLKLEAISGASGRRGPESLVKDSIHVS